MDADASSAPAPITQWLRRAAHGDRTALDAVFAALYPELRRVAHARLHARGAPLEIDTTTLLHEGFLRMAQARELRLLHRHHFFTYMAKTMRNVVIDEARAARAQCRGGHLTRIELDDETTTDIDDDDASSRAERFSLREAMAGLEAEDPALAELVELRFFGGYTEPEVAERLGVNERTVRRRWDKARRFLQLALRGRSFTD